MKSKQFIQQFKAIILSLVLLTTSCTQYDIIHVEQQVFDYSMFEDFKSLKIKLDLVNIQNSGKVPSSMKFAQLIEIVNSELDSEIELPQEAIDLINEDADTILNFGLAKGWMTQLEVNLTKTLISDIGEVGFHRAVSDYEKSILALELKEEDFSKHNKIVNVLMGSEFANPELYMSNYGSRNLFECAAAIVSLVAATMTLASCVTVVACGAALVLVYAASNGVASACGEE